MNVDFYNAIKSRRPAVSRLGALHAQAWEDFERRGLPTRKMESWHYTDVKPWFTFPLSAVAQVSAGSPSLPADAFQIWFRNGQIDPKKTKLPKQIEFRVLTDVSDETFAGQLKSEADRASLEHGGFTDLNLALLEDAVILRIPENTSLLQPVHLVVEWTADVKSAAGAVLIWIEIEQGSSFQMIEWNLGGPQRTAQQWTRVALGENSKMSYARLQTCPMQSAMIGLLTVEQEKGSEFSGANLVRGGGLIRETWLIDHEGEGASTKLSGLAMGTANDHLDLCSVITHQVGRGLSQQKYRALLNGSSRGIFNGKIVIAKDAQEVSSSQLSQSLLLSEKAESNAKPELEIYADNVKANHGATVGRLDPEHVFYLQTRGLKAEQARHLLAEGFAKSSLDLFSDGDMKQALSAWINMQIQSVIEEEVRS